MRNLFSLFFLLCFVATDVLAQIVWSDPLFFTQDSGVTIYFDAKEGTAGLDGFDGTVYAHTGATIDGDNWQNVFSQWGSVDTDYALTSEGNDVYSFTIDNIEDFYQIEEGEIVTKLSFVFRNGDGSLEGKDTGGNDIFIDLYLGGLDIAITSQGSDKAFLEIGETLNITAEMAVLANITLTDNGVDIANENTIDSFSYGYVLQDGLTHTLELTAELDGETVSETITIYPVLSPQIAERPEGIQNGANYLDENTVILSLFAEGKDLIHVVGEFNNWQPLPEYQMNKTPDGKYFWLEISGLNPNEEYAYQYLFDTELQLADPWAEKILDPWSDQYIPEENFPNIEEYPEQGNEIVSVLQTGQEPYEWQITDFERPARTDLVVYELLIRDFSEERNFQFLIDTLDYLSNLGINAIELMPVMEYENNESWGYNPSFMFALDKYYGTPNKFKEFIDECHSRGIAIILDIALNHQFGQSPLVRMYPLNNNPYFNAVATHDFNVGYDMNHETEATREFTRDVIKYWIEEYNIDGYRFDLSKGFTQNNTLGNVGAWNGYDDSRVALWKELHDYMESLSPGFYPILEHLSDNPEETELANYGLMFWGNVNHDFTEAAMGYNSNLHWGYYGTRGWNQPNLLSYMESHDEERMMFKNLEYGNGSGSYSVKNLDVALERAKLTAAFFFAQPGGKMIWQFGELGYDYSIDFGCRVCNKPVRWDYYTEPDRRALYEVYAALAKLKTSQEVFRTTNVDMNVNSNAKRITLVGETMNVNLIGNFGVEDEGINPQFPITGMWYDYFTGESIMVNNTQAEITLGQGEFRLYTSEPLESPIENLLNPSVYVEELSIKELSVKVSPNPIVEKAIVEFDLLENSEVQLWLFNEKGQRVQEINKGQLSMGKQKISLDCTDLNAGIYLLQIQAGNALVTSKVEIF